MENCTLHFPGTVISGVGSIKRIREIIEGTCSHIVLYTDQGVRKAGLIDEILDIITQCNIKVTVVDDVPQEPDCDAAERAIERFRKTEGDFIIGVGGGSVMDLAKLASITVKTSYTVRELLKQPLLGKKGVKTLLIPTTAGTGAEATPNSIVAIPEQQVKVGIVNRAMIADAVVLDGNMIRNLPEKIGAATTIDALAHAIECYTSTKANSFSNLFAGEAFCLIMKNGAEACKCRNALEAKNQMLKAAFYAGVAITSSGTTAVHALSYPLGGRYHIPHGVANAMLLLPVMRFNMDACTEELAQLYDFITEEKQKCDFKEEPKTKAQLLLQKIEELLLQLPLPESLAEYGVKEDALDDLIEAGLDVKRLLNNNKKQVTYHDAKNIYLQILGGKGNG